MSHLMWILPLGLQIIIFNANCNCIIVMILITVICKAAIKIHKMYMITNNVNTKFGKKTWFLGFLKPIKN